MLQTGLRKLLGDVGRQQREHQRLKERSEQPLQGKPADADRRSAAVPVQVGDAKQQDRVSPLPRVSVVGPWVAALCSAVGKWDCARSEAGAWMNCRRRCRATVRDVGATARITCRFAGVAEGRTGKSLPAIVLGILIDKRASASKTTTEEGVRGLQDFISV